MLKNLFGGQRKSLRFTIGLIILFACAVCGCIFLFIAFSPNQSITPTPAPTQSLIIQPTIRPTVQPTARPENTIAPITPTETSAPIIQPTQPPPPAFILINLTSPINAGQTASATIQTAAGANCFISYRTPSGSDSDAVGLGATTADSNGVCSWSWLISGNTNSGTGRVIISANGDVQTFSIEIK